MVIFLRNNPSVTSDLQSLHSLGISPSEMTSLTEITDELGPGAHFLNFENSQKVREKSYHYNLFTTVIRRKRTFYEA